MSLRHHRRRLLVENLENRSLMAADCFNMFAPLDVNDDGKVSATDALRIIDKLNDGDRSLNKLPSVEGFVDVNDDGRLSATDALQVINWLNDNDRAGKPITHWVKAHGEDEVRLGVKTTEKDDGSLVMEVRVQNASVNSSHEVFLKDTWLGSVKTDSRGRGSITLGDDNDLVGRIPELLIKGQANATLAIDRVGSIDVPGEAEDDSPRTGENRRLSATGVFVAQLNTTSNQKTGHVVYGKHGDKQFLGVYARGLTAGQDYEVKINGQVVASLTANATGVIATRVDISQVANFPTIASGLNVSVGDYTGTFQALSERVHLPKTVYVANLSGGSLVGAAQIATAENRTMIGIQLGRVAANTTYDVTVDNVKIAQVTSTRRGFIFFNFDSKRGDTLLADLPTLTADSVIKIGDLVTAKLRKFGR